MKAGRPTKLTPELIEKAKTYLSTCIDKPVWTEKGGMAYVEVNLPTKVGLALFLGINKDTVEEWCKDITPFSGIDNLPSSDHVYFDALNLRQEFSVIVKEIQIEQEKRLINNGLGGLYKEKTTGMLLSKHGYAEKTETDITSKGDKITSAVLPEVIAEADRILKEKKLNENT